MIVRVATENAMKVEAAKKAFAKFFKRVKVVGVAVESTVSPQPISFGEIVRGARERAKAAFRDCELATAGGELRVRYLRVVTQFERDVGPGRVDRRLVDDAACAQLDSGLRQATAAQVHSSDYPRRSPASGRPGS